jgi:hypothetical protein
MQLFKVTFQMDMFISVLYNPSVEHGTLMGSAAAYKLHRLKLAGFT